MPYTVDNAIIYVIVLLAISHLYKVIIKLTKQYILVHKSIIENNGFSKINMLTCIILK